MAFCCQPPEPPSGRASSFLRRRQGEARGGPGSSGGATGTRPRPPPTPQGRASLRPSLRSGTGEGRRGALGGGWRRQRGRAASGFVLEPVAGAAAGGPGHVMPGPGGGQAGIQWQPAGAEGAGAAQAAGAASRLRERARGSAPSALAPALRPPGVGSFGESLASSGRRRWAGARSTRPRAGRGVQRLAGVPEAVGALAPGKCSLGFHSPRLPAAQGRKVCSLRLSSLPQKYSLQGTGGREGQQRWKGGRCCGFSGARDGRRLPVPRGQQQVQRVAQCSAVAAAAERGVACAAQPGAHREGGGPSRSRPRRSCSSVPGWAGGGKCPPGKGTLAVEKGVSGKLVPQRCFASGVRTLSGAGPPERRPSSWYRR